MEIQNGKDCTGFSHAKTTVADFHKLKASKAVIIHTLHNVKIIANKSTKNIEGHFEMACFIA